MAIHTGTPILFSILGQISRLTENTPPYKNVALSTALHQAKPPGVLPITFELEIWNMAWGNPTPPWSRKKCPLFYRWSHMRVRKAMFSNEMLHLDGFYICVCVCVSEASDPKLPVRNSLPVLEQLVNNEWLPLHNAPVINVSTITKTNVPALAQLRKLQNCMMYFPCIFPGSFLSAPYLC